MSKKKIHQEEHTDETWLIPYADMLTLLLALFIVMFAMSEIDKAKLEKLGGEFNIIFAGGSGIMDSSGKNFIDLNSPAPNNSNTETAPVATNYETEDTQLKKLGTSLENEMQAAGLADSVRISLDKSGLNITIEDAIIFEPGSYDMRKGIRPTLLNISKALRPFDNEIIIEGHTDNVPTNSSLIRSNWDLSAIRAVNVLNFMVDYGKLSPKKMSVRAYGEYKPKYDNSTITGRAKNRRVEIFVGRNYN